MSNGSDCCSGCCCSGCLGSIVGLVLLLSAVPFTIIAAVLLLAWGVGWLFNGGHRDSG